MKKILLTISSLIIMIGGVAAIAQGLSGPRAVRLVIPQIHCASCKTRVETALKSLPQISTLESDLKSKSVRVEFKFGRSASETELRSAVAQTGYTVSAFEVVEPATI